MNETAKHTPGPWKVGHRATDINCVNAKIGGEAKLFDVRGWGYLTGHGHGGLGLDEQTAIQIQTANATLAAEAPNMLAVLREAQSCLAMLTEPNEIRRTSVTHAWAQAVEAERKCRVAIDSATTPKPSA